MASLREIKNHMASVRDMEKITNAMYLIASTKVQKARRALEQTRPYFTALREQIKRVFLTEEVDSKYFYPAHGGQYEQGLYGCLVITADRGLAGSYNLNVLKKARERMEQHPHTKLFVVGEYGRQYFAQRSIPIEKSFLYTAQNPSMQRAREISAVLLDFFAQKRVEKVFLIYTDLKNSLSAQAIETQLLPFHREQFALHENELRPEDQNLHFEMPTGMLNSMIESYVVGFLYSALIDSFCCEQNARMNAMRSASQNAQELLKELGMVYNRVRQAAITQEITEIAAGARAQRKRIEEDEDE